MSMTRAYCMKCRVWYAWLKHPVAFCPKCGTRIGLDAWERIAGKWAPVLTHLHGMEVVDGR